VVRNYTHGILDRITAFVRREGETKAEAVRDALRLAPSATYQALTRCVRSGRLVRVRKGFYVVAS
jgi:predicted transcriptional regulator of viral defense system